MRGAGERLRFAAALAEILLWWLLTTAIWLATVTSFTAAEMLAAVVCTLPAAVAARAARQANGGQWRLRIGWLRVIPIVLRDVPVQAAQVWRYALTARRRGVISTVTLPADPEPVAAARRAMAVLAFATTPGSVVVDSVPGGEMVLHRVRPDPGRLTTAVQR
ncbi:MAG: Na+/H+ antiporter subunit E [Mycobacterium sp.]|nr:Na+/H+ antiporter subunit E [Mycobacterium sp.]